MATETQLRPGTVVDTVMDASLATTESSFVPRSKLPNVPATIYDFPSLEPLRYTEFQANHLHLPLRKDILHRAIVYEGDMSRQGTASTKWRDDVHGSGRKLYAQKGTGRARVGDKKSPIRRGGGVAFGPHPRDFSTSLPKKIYDLAWRTAFSYRYRRGELIIVDNIAIPEGTGPRLFKNIFQQNNWGNTNGRSLLVTSSRRLLTDVQKQQVRGLMRIEREKVLQELAEEEKSRMFAAMEDCGDDGRLLDEMDVDVKNILEMGRIVIEYRALQRLLKHHDSDL
jgi:large subunit ribosomal protein L4